MRHAQTDTHTHRHTYEEKARIHSEHINAATGLRIVKYKSTIMPCHVMMCVCVCLCTCILYQCVRLL